MRWLAVAMGLAYCSLLFHLVKRENFVDHTLADQTSVIRFVEDNWLAGKCIGQGSFDELAGSIESIFDFQHAKKTDLLLLKPKTGEVKSDDKD